MNAPSTAAIVVCILIILIMFFKPIMQGIKKIILSIFNNVNKTDPKSKKVNK